MEEKKALARRIKELEKYLEKQRRKWFLGIWLGYSAVAFLLIKTTDFVSVATFFETLIVALVLGALCILPNAIVWHFFNENIRGITNKIKTLEKEYNEMQ